MPDNDKMESVRFIYLLVSNLGLIIAIMGIYTTILKKQIKMEYLIKRLCEKIGVSTDTEL